MNISALSSSPPLLPGLASFLSQLPALLSDLFRRALEPSFEDSHLQLSLEVKLGPFSHQDPSCLHRECRSSLRHNRELSEDSPHAITSPSPTETQATLLLTPHQTVIFPSSPTAVKSIRALVILKCISSVSTHPLTSRLGYPIVQLGSPLQTATGILNLYLNKPSGSHPLSYNLPHLGCGTTVFPVAWSSSTASLTPRDDSKQVLRARPP